MRQAGDVARSTRLRSVPSVKGMPEHCMYRTLLRYRDLRFEL